MEVTTHERWRERGEGERTGKQNQGPDLGLEAEKRGRKG